MGQNLQTFLRIARSLSLEEGRLSKRHPKAEIERKIERKKQTFEDLAEEDWICDRIYNSTCPHHIFSSTEQNIGVLNFLLLMPLHTQSIKCKVCLTFYNIGTQLQHLL
jgi:hypothetical protein